MERYTKLIANLEEVIKHEYDMNLNAFNENRNRILEIIEDSKQDGFECTYISTKITFSNQTKEHREQTIAGGCVRALVYEKWLSEEMNMNDVENDILWLDNYTLFIRTKINHGL